MTPSFRSVATSRYKAHHHSLFHMEIIILFYPVDKRRRYINFSLKTIWNKTKESSEEPIMMVEDIFCHG